MSATPKMRQAPKNAPEPKKPTNPELLKFMEQECKPVKGIFKNYECPGGTSHIVQSKYPGQPIFNQKLEDGQEYTVPLWVARWLNGIDVTAKARNGKINSCFYPKYEYEIPVVDGIIPTGSPVQVPGLGRQRFGFQSLEFAA